MYNSRQVGFPFRGQRGGIGASDSELIDKPPSEGAPYRAATKTLAPPQIMTTPQSAPDNIREEEVNTRVALPPLDALRRLIASEPVVSNQRL